jgi:hypothetical protein
MQFNDDVDFNNWMRNMAKGEAAPAPGVFGVKVEKKLACSRIENVKI